MNSARDFDLLGKSVPQVRVSQNTLDLLLENIHINQYIIICILLLNVVYKETNICIYDRKKLS